MAVSTNAHGLELELEHQADPPAARSKPTFAEVADLFRRHAAFVARSLRRLGIPERDVEDAVQEVFLVAARKRDSIVEGFERSFLYGTAMRVSHNARRGVQRLRRSDEPVASDHADVGAGPTAEELVDQRHARAALDAVLDGMSVEMRAVFTLYTFEEMTTNEIASMLGVPPGTVSSRLRRAREHFDEQVRLLQARLDRRRTR